MAGHIEFGNHADSTVARVVDHVPDLVLRVVVPVGAELLQFGESLALDAKPLIIRKMPVKDIELHCRHRIQIAFDHLDRHPVPRNVEHQPAPRESRAIFDVNARHLRTCADQLRQGRQTAQRPGNAGRLKTRMAFGHIETVRFVFPQFREGRASFAAINRQCLIKVARCNRNTRLFSNLPNETSRCRYQARVGIPSNRSTKCRFDPEFSGTRSHLQWQRHKIRRNHRLPEGDAKEKCSGHVDHHGVASHKVCVIFLSVRGLSGFKPFIDAK